MKGGEGRGGEGRGGEGRGERDRHARTVHAVATLYAHPSSFQALSENDNVG